MSRSDHSTAATFTYRAGSIVLAVGLAVLLVSWSSSATVAANSASLTRYYSGQTEAIPAGNFYTPNFFPGLSGPKGVIEFRAAASGGPLDLYIYRASSQDLSPLIYNLTYSNGTAVSNGIGPCEVSYSYFYYCQSTYLGNASSLSTYAASGGIQVLGSYSLSPGRALDILYYPQDIESLEVLVVNPGSHTVNVTYWDQVIDVPLNSSVGFNLTAALLSVGAALLVVGEAWKAGMRRSPKLQAGR